MSDDHNGESSKNRHGILVLSSIVVIPLLIVMGRIVYELLNFDGKCWSIPGEVIVYSCSLKEYAHLTILSPYAFAVHATV